MNDEVVGQNFIRKSAANKFLLTNCFTTAVNLKQIVSFNSFLKHVF